MKTLFFSLLTFASIVFTGCSPKVTTKLYKPSSHREYSKEEVRVFDISQEVPANAEELGSLKITDNGFSTHCKYDEVIALAKSEVKRAGGNALKITVHRKPGMSSSCHQIQAKIYKCDSLLPDSFPNTSFINNRLHGQDGVPEKSNRNTIVVGYQIGGFTLAGFEYEIRFHDYFGVNIGAGFRGYTGGLKIHTNAKRDSPFFLVSYKDGGFGLLNTFGAEYGAKWIFNHRTDFGFLCQFGLAKILYIDNTLEKILYKGKSAPPITFSIGVGFTW